ncbi:MAG TPA: type III pantothenate kinase [Pseudomonadales bacterium]|jgi:type III pantothenate kinase|nr:pantothenate kinase [Gammaproteobacteria bacterium]MDP6026768.1 type III pantothenate kinase [Pseudomonadales bacterium]MDP6316001.1 type III pantothenate kinase [Pseudomonadales bacterium]MDP7314205.1 type III pantothenate kinase [Pseudomonadales bacterium]MDP7576331.1 type III pantothenate kinase [Pseudomonadales bacterium]|tara:strand:- start:1509 stop:2276 length:768 start_codon:yes stop_codon:yes gene_type:complete
MILCLDVGNSQIYGGVYEGEYLQAQFRHASQTRGSSDELGVFFRIVLRENNINPDNIDTVVICCVVPDLLYSLRACCQKYFGVDPLILRPGIKTGLKILYRDPREVGADRIADAVGAVKLHPDRNLIVADFGTATTMCAITRNKEFLGGNIVPGLRLSMDALESKTAQLPSVEILPPDSGIGRSTIESIQAGLYWSNVGMVKELVSRISEEVFSEEPPLVIATGGFAQLFNREKLFDHVIPDLILTGLKEISRIN